MNLTIEGFVARLVISVLILVLYNLIEARATLTPDQKRGLGIVVLVIVLVFLLFGGYLFPAVR